MLSRSFGGKQEAVPPTPSTDVQQEVAELKSNSAADPKTGETKAASTVDPKSSEPKAATDASPKADDSDFNLADYKLELGQLALLPSEYLGAKVNETVGYRLGETSGRVAGVVAGALSGIVGGCLSAFGLAGGLSGWLTHKKTGKLLGDRDPGKNHPSVEPEIEKLKARIAKLNKPATAPTEQKPAEEPTQKPA